MKQRITKKSVHYTAIRIRMKRAELRYEERIMVCETEEEMDSLTDEYHQLLQHIENTFFD